MNKLRLILGDQLNINHSWFKENNSKTTYVLMEVKEETSYVLHHAQKIIATFAAMRFFAEQLQQKGFEVIYFKINDKKMSRASTKTLIKLSKKKYKRITISRTR
jgi:deoxyribodipyrimidine photolyase-related protein